MDKIQTAAPSATATGKRVEVKRGKITLRRIFSNEFQKEGTVTAEIEQVVTTYSYYPSKKVTSDMQNNLFDAKEFGFEEQEFSSVETRVAWILVPEGTTDAIVKTRLVAAEKKGAVIYKILSNSPILDENQLFSIKQGLRTKADFANSQVSRYPAGHADEGKIIVDKGGNPIYRKVYFWNTPMNDIDLRGDGEAYMSPEIKAELQGASVLKGQTI